MLMNISNAVGDGLHAEIPYSNLMILSSCDPNLIIFEGKILHLVMPLQRQQRFY